MRRLSAIALAAACCLLLASAHAAALEDKRVGLRSRPAFACGAERNPVHARPYRRHENYAASLGAAEQSRRPRRRARSKSQPRTRTTDAPAQQAPRPKETPEAARQDEGGESEKDAAPQPRRLDAERPAALARENAGKSEEQLVAEALAEAIRGALRPPKAGETRVRGVLVRIECPEKGIVFHVKADGRVLRLHTDSFNRLHLMAYTREAGGQVTCGERKPESHVVVTFRPAPDAKSKSDGSLAAVEFVPADFQLKQ